MMITQNLTVLYTEQTTDGDGAIYRAVIGATGKPLATLPISNPVVVDGTITLRSNSPILNDQGNPVQPGDTYTITFDDPGPASADATQAS